MKVVATTVGRKGPDDESWNDRRLEASEQAVAQAAKLGADVIVLPGGFLFTRKTESRNDMATALISMAKKSDIAVIFGVDQKMKNPRTDDEILCTGHLLPYYGYAWSPSENILHLWQQRSSTSDNQWYASDGCCNEERLLGIGNDTVAVLMCGEIFNQRIRHGLANYQPRPKVAVDVAHVGSGFRVFQGMKVLAAFGLPSVCSVHAQCKYAVKHCYVPPGKRLSSRIWDDYIYGPPRIELKLWTF